LINAAALGVVARWDPGFMPTLPGSSGTDPMVLYTLSAVGLVLGAILLIGGMMQRLRPANKKAWGLITIIFSIPSVIMGGGFIIGFILGTIGGAKALSKPKLQSTKKRIPFLKMSDDAKIMRIEGAGPKIMAPLFITFIITALLSYIYRPTFDYPILNIVVLAIGALFLAAGVPFWIASVGLFLGAWNKEKLETHGPFAVMLNPIYSSFIVFVIPGISLVLNWWPILLTSVVTYAAQRIFIHEEDNALREKFGSQYEEYRRKVLIKFL
jgi:protein-S-isoprenylcysteine O-methyltransferase Ste14